MASQILITMDDLETAVRLNAALEVAKLSTAMFSVIHNTFNRPATGHVGCTRIIEVFMTSFTVSCPLWCLATVLDVPAQRSQ
jgi:hypothetical protein